MPDSITDSVTLRTSKDRCWTGFTICLVFLVIALVVHFPSTIFYVVIRTLLVPSSVLGGAVFATGLLSNKYDAVLNADGIQFGTFSGKRHYKWNDIKAVYVLREMTGRRVCLELKSQPPSATTGRIALKSLPENYGMLAEDLAMTLLKWQREYDSTKAN